MKREVSKEAKILVAGFGGQGIMFFGKIISLAAILENRQTTYIRSYGAEMRGGTAHCQVKISDKDIASPIFAHPTFAVIMNQPSLDKFKDSFTNDTIVILNSSLVKKNALPESKNVFTYAFNELADELGDIKIANVVALGALIRITEVVKKKSVEEVLKNYFSSKPPLLKLNIKALEKGWQIN